MKISQIAYLASQSASKEPSLIPKVVDFAKRHFGLIALTSIAGIATLTLGIYHIYATYFASNTDNQNLNN